MKFSEKVKGWLRTIAIVALVGWACIATIRDVTTSAEQRGYDRGYAKAEADFKQRTEVSIPGGKRYVMNGPIGLEVLNNGSASVVYYSYPNGVERLATYPDLVYVVHDALPSPALKNLNGYAVAWDGQVKKLGSGGRNIYLLDYQDATRRMEGRINPPEIRGVADVIRLKNPGFRAGRLNATVLADGNETFKHWLESDRMQSYIAENVLINW